MPQNFKIDKKRHIVVKWIHLSFRSKYKKINKSMEKKEKNVREKNSL